MTDDHYARRQDGPLPGATASAPRIAVDIRALVGPPSGIGYFTISMLQELTNLGQAEYVGMAHRPAAPEAQAALEIEMESHPGPFGVWWQQIQLPRRLARGDLDLLWSPITVLPARLRVPGVVTVHDLTVLSHPHTHRAKVRWSVIPFLARTVRQATTITAISKATADDLIARFPDAAAKIEIVHNGIDSIFVPGSDDAKVRTRSELGCPDGYILYAGTLEPRKNVDRLLSAWESLNLARRLPIVLVGPYGWRSENLLTRIDSLSDQGVVYKGRVDRSELVRLVQSATVFAYPSLYEGFGLPPAEAMACGVPTVVSNCSSLPEIVGDSGIQVDPDDVASIADGIDRVLNDPALASDLAERGLERAKMFTWARSAGAMHQIFAAALR